MQTVENSWALSRFAVSHFRTQEWLSIIDAEGHEVLCIRELDKLPADVRKILDEELARREFVPIIQRITSVTCRRRSFAVECGNRSRIDFVSVGQRR